MSLEIPSSLNHSLIICSRIKDLHMNMCSEEKLGFLERVRLRHKLAHVFISQTLFILLKLPGVL